MKTLSSSEILAVSGAFSLESLVESCVTGAFLGGTIGFFSAATVVTGACVGAATFGTINLIYQIAIGIDHYNQPNCYPNGYYYYA